MKLNEIFNEFTLGQMQEVGVMSVIPLIEKEKTESPVAPLTDLKFTGTSTYGTMKFLNLNKEKPVIIPAGYMALTKQLAQDHALPISHLLPTNPHEQMVDFACCVEQTQGGYIQVENDFEFQLLPIFVRKENVKDSYGRVIQTRIEDQRSFSRLWPHISAFQNKMIQNNEAHIVWFFNKFVSKLDEFNAEFESVKGQRGAIVLINNQIVGIEIAPSTEDWEILWKRLIRETYGSEVIRLSYENLTGTFMKKEENKLNLDSVTSIAGLRDTISFHNEARTDKVVDQLFELFESAKTLSSEKGNFEGIVYEASALGKDKLVEIYSKDNKVIYASIVL